MRDDHTRSLDNIERTSKCFEIVNLVIKRCTRFLMTALQSAIGGAVAEWVCASPGDRTFDGSSSTSVKTFSSELSQFRLPHLPVSFG